MGNYGVVFDTDTLKVIGMAPVFDENLSLLPYAEEEDFKNIGAELINLKDFQFEILKSEKFPVKRVKI